MSDVQWTHHSKFPDFEFGDDPHNEDDYNPGYIGNNSDKHAVVFTADDPDMPDEIYPLTMVENELQEGGLYEEIVPLVLYYDSYQQAIANDKRHERICDALVSLKPSAYVKVRENINNFLTVTEKGNNMVHYYTPSLTYKVVENDGDIVDIDDVALVCFAMLANRHSFEIRNTTVSGWQNEDRALVKVVDWQSQMDWYAKHCPEFDPTDDMHATWPFEVDSIRARIMHEIINYETGSYPDAEVK